jgi:hypothetical protein
MDRRQPFLGILPYLLRGKRPTYSTDAKVGRVLGVYADSVPVRSGWESLQSAGRNWRADL